MAPKKRSGGPRRSPPRALSGGPSRPERVDFVPAGKGLGRRGHDPARSGSRCAGSPDAPGEISYGMAAVIPRSGVDVEADGHNGGFAFLHLRRHGPDAVRAPTLDGGEAGLDAGSGPIGLVEPTGVRPPQPHHLRPGTHSVAFMVLPGLKVRLTSGPDGQGVVFFRAIVA